MPEEIPQLNPKYVVGNRWEVVRKLGEGGFGAVYMVQDKMSNTQCAMKVETIDSKIAVLKLEAFVLQKLQGKVHALRYYGMNTFENLRYLVMQLAGRNLSDLRRAVAGQRFTVHTTVRLCIQCVEAVRDIHDVGFLHRDIKPANFAIGRDSDNCRTLYMLDFGLARSFTHRSGEIRAPRTKCGFRGTIRYASPSAHEGKELGRHDDIFCILYMAIELRFGMLPWRDVVNKDDVGKAKLSIKPNELLKDFPKEFYDWYNMLLKLKFMDRPDYEWFNEKMRQIIKVKGYKEENPYDWEEGGDSFVHTVIQAAVDNPYESQMQEQKEVIKSHSKDK